MSMWLGYLFKMCVVCVSVVTIASLITPAPSTPINNINEYSITNKACPKSKLNKIENEKICLKDGKKYRWAIKKSTPLSETKPLPTSSPTPISNTKSTLDINDFKSLCDHDPMAPDQLLKYQKEAIKRNACQPPYRFVSKQITSGPSSTLNNNLVSTSQCNINPLKWNYKTSKWNPNYRIKVIPFQTDDYKISTNPKDDWKDFFDYFSNALDNMTDVPSNYRFDFDQEYNYVPVSLQKLDLGAKYMHGDPNVRSRTKQLAEIIVNKVDGRVDFSNYDAIWLLPPRNISIDVLSNFIINGPLYTNEKRFDVGIYLGTRYDDFGSEKWNARDPFGVLHEWLVHVSNTIDDTYGDFNSNQNVGHFGTGRWGNTSGAISDFLGFDKWQLKMISDTQVLCINTNKSSTIWLKPLNSDGMYEKLAIIKLSQNTAITLQSMRSIGYNYKLPKDQNGVLVVEVDTEKMYDNSIHADGQYVVCPKRNNNFTVHGGCKDKNLYDAALKINESITYKGYKITVIESGDFGDIVRIDKI